MKSARTLVLVIVGLIWVAGCSSSLVNQLYRLQWIPDDYRYGDLYRLSNLKEFKDPKSECPPSVLTKPRAGKKVALYIVGDSFTEPQRVDSSDFAVDKYHYAHWGTLLHLKLDSNYTNIVLLESVERSVREHFAAPLNNVVPDTATFVTLHRDTHLMSRLDNHFASGPTEDRLNTLLFQFDPVLKLKEWKSWLNYRFFDRTDPKVTVSANGRSIVYHVDTDTTLINSSFIHISDSEVDSVVQVINRDQVLLKNMGFDQVWLSLIPNKASVVMPEYGLYNRLIYRIQQHPSLEVTSLPILTDFQAAKQNPYLKGDSHWSCVGQRLWLDRVNQEIMKIYLSE